MGNDSIDGGLDDDRLFGGDGMDTLNGGDGRDLLVGGVGEDIFYGGAGPDSIFSGEWEVVDNVQGFSSTVFDNEADTVFGGDGEDNLFLQSGDVAYGGADRDFFFLDVRDDVENTVTIKDFDTSEDVFVVYYPKEDGGAPVLDITFSEAENGAFVTADGVEIAFLEGRIDVGQVLIQSAGV
jgi:Ca2+-binding RTX toxin-like protein